MSDYAHVALDTLLLLQEAMDVCCDAGEFGRMAAGEVGDSLQLRSVTLELIDDRSLTVEGSAGSEPKDEAYVQWHDDVARQMHSGVPYYDTRFGTPVVHAYGFPLLYGGRAVGAMFVTNDGALGDEALEALRAIARTASQCLALFSLRGQLDSQTAEFVTLAEISKAINSQLDLTDLLNLLAATALKLTRGDTASVSVLAADDSVELAAVCGLHEQTLSIDGLGGLATIVSEVAQTGLGVLATEVDALEQPAYQELAAARGVRSLIASPLKLKDEILGVLAVDICADDRRFGAKDLEMVAAMADQAGVAIENARLYGEMQDLYVATIRSLAFTIEAKDKFTRGHSDRVTEYAVAIAERMGFSQGEISTLRFAGILHDIGKIAISEEILNKPGKLTPLEREVIETHPTESARIIRPIGFLKEVVPIVEHHHEWFDGSGYGAGLAAEAIPRGARVLAVADAFEAMTSDRPYHAARPWPDAVAELKRCSGTQFDPQVVEVFVGMILESLEIEDEAS